MILATDNHPGFNPGGYYCTCLEQLGSCSGCTDVQACNYSSDAASSDPNSCIYPTSGLDCNGNSLCDGTWVEDITYGSCSDYSLDECSSIVGLYGTRCDTQAILGSGVFLILISLLSYVAINSEFKWDLWFDAVEFAVEGTPQLVAGTLFTAWIFPFEIISILLIVATAAAIALAYDSKRKKNDA